MNGTHPVEAGVVYNLTMDKLRCQKLTESAHLPTRGSDFAAGLDLYAAVATTVPARGFVSVSTGIAVAVPEGFYGRIAPRSGLAAKFGIDTLAGVIDSDYRGEVLCVLANHSDKDFAIEPGHRIAQLLIESIITPQPKWVENLSETKRGSGGFGSSDRK